MPEFLQLAQFHALILASPQYAALVNCQPLVAIEAEYDAEGSSALITLI